MKSLKLAVLAATVLFSLNSHARNFYKATFKLNAQYSNIVDGTKDLINELKLTVRYSDDHDFCEVVVGATAFDCKTYHPDDQPEETAITMDRGVGGLVVATALADLRCDPTLLTSFNRLATYLDDTINIEWQGDDFYQQIHDTQPESFHVWMYDMTRGVKY